MNQPESFAYYSGVSEYFFYSGRACRCYNIKIFGLFAQNKVPNRATYNVSFVSAGLEPFRYIHRVAVYVMIVDLMFILGINKRFLYQYAVFFRRVTKPQSSSVPLYAMPEQP